MMFYHFSTNHVKDGGHSAKCGQGRLKYHCGQDELSAKLKSLPPFSLS